MSTSLLRRVFAAGEIQTRAGRDLVEERYSTLRRQIPIIYMLAAVNLFGLQLSSEGRLELGLNVPTVTAAIAVLRITQWMWSRNDATHELMLRRMRQTTALSLIICTLVFLWCFHLLRDGVGESGLAVMLFGGLTAIGVTYGLSALPAAARIPLLVLALPLAVLALLSNDPLFIGAALSLSFVSLLLLRLLDVNNSHFTALVRSRSIIAREQELAEAARKEALVAATTDFLTGLPNRRAFVAALERQFEELTDEDCFAVGILDLDRFKVINDTFGHASGDKLLTTVARRLRTAAGKSALVARLGGDEFGILVRGVRTPGDAEAAARKVVRAVNKAARIDGRGISISVCCGVALARSGTDGSPSRILADADLALYDAKERTDLGVALFEDWMEVPRRRRIRIERAIQAPRVHERIQLVYQPIFDLRSGKLIANEALARWTDEELGEISPAEFIPVAEQLNVIGKLTRHLMEKAFCEAATWPEHVRLSFNLSAVDLCVDGSAATILGALEAAGLPTTRLQVEVTETALLRDFERARTNLADLRSAGVTVVLDDFGAGYASIGYLKRLRFDQIKLDGGLLTAAAEDADGERLLEAVIGLCKALGVQTVAEHVEGEQQLKLLMELGCTAAQGFWLQRPMRPADCRRFSQAAALFAGGSADAGQATGSTARSA